MVPASLHCSLYAQAETALASLHHKGKEQILLSASQLSFLKEQLAQYDISDYFSDIWGLSDYYAHSKAELAKRMIEEKGLRKEEVVFIGDSVHDYEVACSVGCTCILVAAAEVLQGYDLVVITTAHKSYDLEMIQKNSKAIFDTRNAMKDYFAYDNVELL